MTTYTCATVFLAHFAYLTIPCQWDSRNPLGGLQRLGIAELHLRCKNCTSDVDPIIVRRPLQWFTRIDRFILLFLPLAEEIGDFLSIFSLNPVFLSFLFIFLLVGNFGRLNKVMFCVFNRT